jgi:mono/diheme cytochrome c family protein
MLTMRTPSTVHAAQAPRGPEAGAPRRPTPVAFALLAAALLALLAPAAACSNGASSGATSADAATSDAAIGDTPAALTWHRDVRPIVEARCAGCHESGGFAPFALKSYGDAYDHRDVMAITLAGKLMPPWPPNDTCNAYTHDRSITDAQRATLVEWARGPAVEGDPATFVPLPADPLTTIRADKTLQMATSYTPVESPDEYRCFVMDWNETTTKYVTGLNVRPGLMPIVHHAIAFLIKPADVGTVTSMDAADPAPGYKCFGGVGINGADWLGAWAPGAMPSSFPASSGLEVVPGSKVVVQIHWVHIHRLSAYAAFARPTFAA